MSWRRKRNVQRHKEALYVYRCFESHQEALAAITKESENLWKVVSSCRNGVAYETQCSCLDGYQSGVSCIHVHAVAIFDEAGSGIFRPLRLDAGETSTSNACASTATITAKRREYAPEVESYDNVNDEIVAPEDVQKQDNRKEALQTTESMKALLSELAGELSRVDRFDILNRLNEAVNGVVRNAVNEMLGDGNKGRLTIKTERKRNGKKFMDDDSNLEEEARNILQTDRKLLQTCFICGERNPDANDDDEVV